MIRITSQYPTLAMDLSPYRDVVEFYFDDCGADGAYPITHDEAKAIAAFFEEHLHQVDELVVHCYGQGRSPAIAIAAARFMEQEANAFRMAADYPDHNQYVLDQITAVFS